MTPDGSAVSSAIDGAFHQAVLANTIYDSPWLLVVLAILAVVTLLGKALNRRR